MTEALGELAAPVPVTASMPRPEMGGPSSAVVPLACRQPCVHATGGEMNIYVFANQKGGVGKTTIALGIGCALARRGSRVLLTASETMGSKGTAPCSQPALCATLEKRGSPCRTTVEWQRRRHERYGAGSRLACERAAVRGPESIGRRSHGRDRSGDASASAMDTRRRLWPSIRLRCFTRLHACRDHQPVRGRAATLSTEP